MVANDAEHVQSKLKEVKFSINVKGGFSIGGLGALRGPQN